MPADSNPTFQQTLAAIYRDEAPRVLATLIRIFGDFDLAEDAMHEAFAAPAAQWPKDGIPGNPRAWLVSTGRFKTIDAIRRDTRLFASLRADLDRPNAEQELSLPYDENAIEDDRLRLIFTCCHPALSLEGRRSASIGPEMHH